MLIQATQLRPGMILEYNNGLWRVMAISHITPGNWRGMVQTKLRNIKTGGQTENRFRSEDRVERVILDQVRMQFLYQEGDDFHFMNSETYDQVSLPRELIEDVAQFLTPNMEVEVEVLDVNEAEAQRTAMIRRNMNLGDAGRTDARVGHLEVDHFFQLFVNARGEALDAVRVQISGYSRGPKLRWIFRRHQR